MDLTLPVKTGLITETVKAVPGILLSSLYKN